MMDRLTRSAPEERSSLLPQTVRLLDSLLEAGTYRDLERLTGAALEGTASYGARPDPSLPFVRFRVTGADPAVLDFAGMSAPGFDVLEVGGDGFQFHWRNDLARAFEEQMPVIGRFRAPSGAPGAAVDHVVLPMLARHRVRKLWGWFTFGRPGLACDRVAPVLDAPALDRSQRSRLAQLSRGSPAGPAPSGQPRGARSVPV